MSAPGIRMELNVKCELWKAAAAKCLERSCEASVCRALRKSGGSDSVARRGTLPSAREKLLARQSRGGDAELGWKTFIL